MRAGWGIAARIAYVATALVLLGAGPAHAATQRFGFNDTAYYKDEINRSVFLSKFAASGAGLLRQPLHLSPYEPVEGQPIQAFWNQFDVEYQDLRARNAGLVLTVVDVPAWARVAGWQAGCGGQTPCFAPPDVRRPEVAAAWKRWIAEIARRYSQPGMPPLAGIEIWNEPNIKAFWEVPQDPDLYGQMLALADQAVESVTTQIPVISGGTSSYKQADTAMDHKYTTFINDLYTHDGAGHFDAIGFHSYPCSQNGGDVESVRSELNAVRAIRDAHGDAARPLWLNEMGVHSGTTPALEHCGAVYSEAQQRDALGGLLDMAKAEHAAHDDLPVVAVHSLMNNQTRNVLGQPNSGRGSEYGLVAWWTNLLLQFTTQDKPAFARVSCEFKATC